MEQEILNWKNHKGVQLHGKIWKPQSQPKAIIYIIHDLFEYSDNYDHLANFFITENYLVASMDRRGYGRSQIKTSKPNHFSALHNDFESFMKRIRNGHKTLPEIIISQGFGSNQALDYLISRKNQNIKGLVCLSPCINCHLAPPKHIQNLSIIFPGFMKKKLTKLNIDPEKISDTPSLLSGYTRGSLTSFKIPILLWLEMKKKSDKILRNKHKINTPLLLIHAKNNPFASIHNSHKLVKNTSETTTLLILEKGKHQLTGINNPRELFEQINKWFNKLKL